MATLLERLRNHDWFYAYSDDHRVWKRGEQRTKELYSELVKRECPYNMGDIRMTVQKMILEDFTEVETNRWSRDPEKTRYVAPAQRSELIERSRAEEVLRWIDSNENR